MEYCPNSGKEIFRTRAPAERLLALLCKRAGKHTGSVYRCQHCHQFHITHYGYELHDTLDSWLIPARPSKKMLRSRRNKLKKLNRKFRPRNLPLIHVDIPMNIKLIPPVTCTNKEFCLVLSNSIGVVKAVMGCWLGCCHIIAGDAEYMLRNSPLFAKEVKKAVGNAITARRKFIFNMYNPQPGELKLFDIETFHESFREFFSEDITKEQYIEFWEGMGGEAYCRYKNFFYSMEYKYERYLQRCGLTREVKTIAMALTTAQLFYLAHEHFVGLVTDRELKLPAFTPGFRRVCQAFDAEAVFKSWQLVTDALCQGLPPMTETEINDIRLASDTINERLLDMYIIKDIEQKVTVDFQEVFSNRKQQLAAIQRIDEMKRMVAESELKFINEQKQRKTNEED